MVEMQSHTVDRGLLQFFLLRAEIVGSKFGKRQVRFAIRCRGCVLGRLAAMEHEILDAASCRDAHEFSLEQSKQFLGRCLVNDSIGFGDFANRKVSSFIFDSEYDPPATAALFQGYHVPPWGKYCSMRAQCH